ncbi:MAG: PrgI family protein [Bacteroidaceae bacterium]|nr:PrgI family protein [Bacteroidaceae bacterium]
MANYISVPRDLTKVKTKVMFNLTKRQLICFSIGALIGVPTFFFMKGIASDTAATLVMMIVMMPLFFLAMYEKNGQPLEVFLEHFVQATFIRPKERPYKTNNYYAALAKKAQLDKEVDKIVGSKEEAQKG